MLFIESCNTFAEINQWNQQLDQESEDAQEGWNTAEQSRRNTVAIYDRMDAVRKNIEFAREQLEISKAIGQARLVQVQALLKAHPDTDHLNPSGAVWRSGQNAGRPKTILRSLYEVEFDISAEEQGIENPSQHRTD